ncbi:MAG: guanylate cyclase [Gallionellales bacterium RIFCSPLOWO2_02_FULL_57_47]|nr:MAG: guanylate cyclase [Gallionellales bacterium RIFCSPLOWO2_02_FULL_57_47]OGT14948.1 MAG: guanylate cyclase [Gallionellales bacterium RIFCSPHIGHO2_02_FULL_57_16]
MALSFLKTKLTGRDSKAAEFLLAFFSVFIVIALYYNQNSFVEAFEARTYDLRFKSLRGAVPPSADIAIIAIDDKSIAELGRFPWTRSQYVRLLDRLSAAGAKVLLVDAFFSEKETPAIDRSFAAAIRKAGNVVLAVPFDFDKQLRVIGSTHSLPEIESAAAGIGHINLLPEDDGVNRRNKLLIEENGKLVPSLGLMGAMTALGEKEFIPGLFEIRLGDRHIPVDGNYSMWINYAGPPGNYPRYSFTDIVNGRIDPALLKGKVLFLGATALGIYDMRVTPFYNNTPGVEVHAAVADSIISGRFIRRTGLEALLDMALAVVLGLLAFYLTMRLRLHAAIPAVFLLSAGYVWLSYWFFLQGHWVSMIYPPLAAMIALAAGGSFRYLVLDRSAREMRSMFSSYLSAKLVARLEKEPDAAKIGGDNKQVTVLFTDIKGFTSFSETRSPQEVVTRLNEYLAAMVQVIDRFDGTVDKFIGDGIMVYWGAPLAQPDHAKLAVACMLEMKKTMAQLGVNWEKEGVVPFVIRGGALSGEVVAGNIGCHGKKMEYTLIGDTVNQASRLEGTAKYYGVSFLLGESTYLLTRDTYRYRELDKIRVVGKHVPVTVYELLGTLSEPEDNRVAKFAAALALYRAHRWEEAEKYFASILDEIPGDKPSQIYLERCEYYKNNPPPMDWDGVFNRVDK